jgi:hypothetical protein
MSVNHEGMILTGENRSPRKHAQMPLFQNRFQVKWPGIEPFERNDRPTANSVLNEEHLLRLQKKTAESSTRMELGWVRLLEHYDVIDMMTMVIMVHIL